MRLFQPIIRYIPRHMQIAYRIGIKKIFCNLFSDIKCLLRVIPTFLTLEIFILKLILLYYLF